MSAVARLAMANWLWCWEWWWGARTGRPLTTNPRQKKHRRPRIPKYPPKAAEARGEVPVLPLLGTTRAGVRKVMAGLGQNEVPVLVAGLPFTTPLEKDPRELGLLGRVAAKEKKAAAVGGCSLRRRPRIRIMMMMVLNCAIKKNGRMGE